MKDEIDFEELYDAIEASIDADTLYDAGDMAYGSIPEEARYEGMPITVVEHEGGEGQGELAMLVIKIGDEFYKMDYSYYSYNGFDTEGCSFRKVKPVVREVTFYE